MELAPIVFLVYNRPIHTLRTLTALMENPLASESKLFVFCDGPKEGASLEELKAIEETHKVIGTQQWCKEIEIYKSNENKGLAKATIYGITQIVNRFGKVIVLEDDILPATHFLTYMNEGLNLFENNMEISSINGFAVDFLSKHNFPPYFLINNADCWGWATWKNRWDDFTYDAKHLKNKLIELDCLKRFEYGGHMAILEAQINGSIDTWDIQWHSVNILKNRKGVFPRFPFVKNIGMDGSGTHYNDKSQDQTEPKIIFNNYKISLKEYALKNNLKFKPRVEKKFRKHYIKHFRQSLYTRIINKIHRMFKELFKITK